MTMTMTSKTAITTGRHHSFQDGLSFSSSSREGPQSEPMLFLNNTKSSSLDFMRYTKQPSAVRKGEITSSVMASNPQESPVSPLSSTFYTPNLEVAEEEEDRISDEGLSEYQMQTIDTLQDDDIALTFHPTSIQGLGINLSSHFSNLQDKFIKDQQKKDGVNSTESSIAIRRGRQGPILDQSTLKGRSVEKTASISGRGSAETKRPITPKFPNRSSSLRKSESVQLPETPLKRVPSREEDRKNMARLDTIDYKFENNELLEGQQTQFQKDDQFSTQISPSMEAGPSNWRERKRSSLNEMQSGRISRTSAFEFVKGPDGYKRNSRHSDDIVSLRSPPTRLLRAISPTNIELQSEDERVGSSEASGFAYLPSGHEKPSKAAIQHLDEQILSQNDFYRAVAAMQFDPPMRTEDKGNDVKSKSDWVGLFVSILLVIIFITLFCIFEAPYFWFAISPAVDIVAAYLFLSTVIGFIITAVMNPGRIPKRLDVAPLTAASLQIQRQSFLLPEMDQLDEDSPRKHLALAKLRQQIKDVIPSGGFSVSPTSKEGQKKTVVAASIATPPRILERPSRLSKIEGEAGNQMPRNLSSPMPLQAGVRVVPLTDSAGRKTWLVYNESKSDILSPRSRSFPLSFRKKEIEQESKSKRGSSQERQIDLEKQVIPRQVDVHHFPVQLRWCPQCESFPSPRAFHCRRCRHCCQNFHYHCSWINNDIGSRNLPVFIAFLSTALLSCIYVVVFSALHLDRLARRSDQNDVHYGLHLPGISTYTGSFRNAVAGSPTTVIIFVMGLVGAAFFTHRLSLHLLCAAQAQTVMQRVSSSGRLTYFQPEVNRCASNYEQLFPSQQLRKDISKRFHISRPLNPFDSGSNLYNLKHSLFYSHDYSIASLCRSQRQHPLS